ncbi:MAG: M28 family peptidase [Bacteroidota bacterium]
MAVVRFLIFTLFLVSNIVPAQNSIEKQLSVQVSQTNLRGHVRTLVGFGNRWGGTPSGDRAARYVAETLNRYGLEVETITDPERLVFVHTKWSLRIGRPRRLRGLIKNEWLAGFSPSVKSTRARLVDLVDEEQRDSLEGAAVLTERLVDSELYDQLVNRGAVAILSFAPGDSMSYAGWSMISNLPESSENKIPLYNLSWGNGNRLRNELRAGETIELTFDARTRVESGSPKTVTGLLRGSSDQYFIVCAHGDSDAGGPGADDNASGVAGVLEMARVLTHMIRNGKLDRPTVGIKFVVWGAEYYSTEHFVRTHGERLADIAGVLNYDEIGTGATRNCIYFESNDVEHNRELLIVLNSIGEEYYGKAGFWEEATTNPSQGGTDSYVFLPEHLERLSAPSALIPSVTVYTAAWNSLRTFPQTEGWTSRAWKGHPDSVTIDFSRYYHSSHDLPEVTTEREPFNMSWAVKAIGIALLRIAWAR